MRTAGQQTFWSLNSTATATYEHFPYPLENLTGTVRIEANVSRWDVASRYDGDNRVITLNGHVRIHWRHLAST